MGEKDNTTLYTEAERVKLTNLFLPIACEELSDASFGGVDVRAYLINSSDHKSEFVLEVCPNSYMPDPHKILTRGNLNKPFDVFQYEEFLECRYETFYDVYAALIRIQSYIFSPEGE
jgi:hypothetical protein